MVGQEQVGAGGAGQQTSEHREVLGNVDINLRQPWLCVQQPWVCCQGLQVTHSQALQPPAGSGQQRVGDGRALQRYARQEWKPARANPLPSCCGPPGRLRRRHRQHAQPVHAAGHRRQEDAVQRSKDCMLERWKDGEAGRCAAGCGTARRGRRAPLKLACGHGEMECRRHGCLFCWDVCRRWICAGTRLDQHKGQRSGSEHADVSDQKMRRSRRCCRADQAWQSAGGGSCGSEGRGSQGSADGSRSSAVAGALLICRSRMGAAHMQSPTPPPSLLPMQMQAAVAAHFRPFARSSIKSWNPGW